VGVFRFWRWSRAGATLLLSSIVRREAVVISLAIGILITIVIGAILLWVIDRLHGDSRWS
jgi:ABC-type transport system involved in multi-copper enzyme maturation permease subunit